MTPNTISTLIVNAIQTYGAEMLIVVGAVFTVIVGFFVFRMGLSFFDYDGFWGLSGLRDTDWDDTFADDDGREYAERKHRIFGMQRNYYDGRGWTRYRD